MTNKYQRAKEAERGRRRRAEAKAAKLGITVEELPPRRPPMTNAERQRRFYKRQKDKMWVRGEEIKIFSDMLHERGAIIKNSVSPSQKRTRSLPISCNYWIKNSPALPLPSDCYAPPYALHPIMSATLCTSHVAHTLPIHPGWFALANGCRPSRHRPPVHKRRPLFPSTTNHLITTIYPIPLIYLFTYTHTYTYHSLITSLFLFLHSLPFYPLPQPASRARQRDSRCKRHKLSGCHQPYDPTVHDSSSVSAAGLLYKRCRQSTCLIRFLLIQRLNTFWTAVSEGGIMH
jgi:hypothetical protein